jgi:hypothetical protein
MNWKGTLCMLGAVLFCTSLMASAGPPAQSTAALQQAVERPIAVTAQAEEAKPAKPAKRGLDKIVPPRPTVFKAIGAPGTRGEPIPIEAPVTDEMGNTCGAGDDCATRAGEDLNYEVTINDYGMWTISLCGSDFDTYLFVGTTFCGQEIGYNDDFCGLQSQLSAAIGPGVYYVDIEPYSETYCGNYVLNIWWEEIPGADFVVDAPYAGPTDPMRTTCGAGDDCAIRVGEDHTYQVNIPNAGIWTFSLCGSTFDTYMFVGTSICGQEIGYNDDFCGLQSQLTATLAAAGAYFVDIEPYSSTYCGDYVLNVWEEIPLDGACCVGLDCVATNTQLECDGLGGIWYVNEDCFGDPPFQCPETPANDLCENATPVNAPYPVTIEGESTQLATIDCPGFLDWTAIWYDLELPYANNDVTVTICPPGEDLFTVGVILMDDCNCDDYILYSGYTFFTCPSGYTGVTINFNQVQGYTHILFPAYAINAAGAGMVFDITFNVVEHQACYVECPEGGIPEGEPDCYDGYVDNYNGGCNSYPYIWQPINCGDTICGTSGVYYNAYYRDTDWFEKQFTSPTTVTWTAIAEFPVLIFIINGGSGNCADYSILSYTTGGECQEVSLTEDIAPGLYWFWIGPSDWGNYPCGADSEYVATLTCEAVTGACCDDDTGICEDGVEGEQCPPPLRFAANTLCADLSPPCGGCPESMIYIEIMTDPYPTETTWQVTDHETGIVLGSGGPYSLQYTLYTEGVCVPTDSCSDFTIFDAYGDGIYAPGGYTVSFDGEVVYSCMGQGWYGYSETVEMIGPGCEWPPGACCIDVEGVWECLYTNTEPECDDLGGRFYEGEDCFGDPPFECPQCTVDFCVDAPYEGDFENTCGAGNDCALGTSEEHEYDVTIPHDGVWTFSLCGSAYDTYLYVGTAQCTQDIGYNDDYCGLQSQLTAAVSAGHCFVTVEGYGGACGSYVLNIWEMIPCDTECPEGGTPEGEPICYDGYVDTYNGGCNTPPDYPFQPITCNETMCGTSGVYANFYYRDTDWFRLELPAATHVTWTICAEFPPLIFVMDAGSENCVDYAILGYTVGEPFVQASFGTDVSAGVYWLWAGPADWGNYPCGVQYVATAIVEPDVCICGDFDNDNDVDEDDYWLFLDAFGSCVGDPKYLEDADFDEDGCITLVDYQAWIQCYRNANPGKALPNIRRTVSGNAHQGGSQTPAGPVPR